MSVISFPNKIDHFVFDPHHIFFSLSFFFCFRRPLPLSPAMKPLGCQPHAASSVCFSCWRCRVSLFPLVGTKHTGRLDGTSGEKNVSQQRVAFWWFLIFALRLPEVTGERIIGGWEVQPYSIKHQASLLFMNFHFCGGTLIHPQWVVSAAHCWRPWVAAPALSRDRGRPDSGLSSFSGDELPELPCCPSLVVVAICHFLCFRPWYPNWTNVIRLIKIKSNCH